MKICVGDPTYPQYDVFLNGQKVWARTASETNSRGWVEIYVLDTEGLPINRETRDGRTERDDGTPFLPVTAKAYGRVEIRKKDPDAPQERQ